MVSHKTQDWLDRRERVARAINRQLAAEHVGKYGNLHGPGTTGTWLPWNSGWHVRQASYAIGEIGARAVHAGLIEPSQIAPMLVAAGGHDIEQELSDHDTPDALAGRAPRGEGANEIASADRVVAELKKHPDLFDDADIAMAREGVWATIVSKRPSGHVFQSVGDPAVMGRGGGTQPKAQMLMADADLASLAMPGTGVLGGALHHLQVESKQGRVELPNRIEDLARTPIDPDRFRAKIDGQITFTESKLEAPSDPNMPDARYYLEPTREWAAPGLEQNLELWETIREQFDNDVADGKFSGAALLGAIQTSAFYEQHGRLPEPGEVAEIIDVRDVDDVPLNPDEPAAPTTPEPPGSARPARETVTLQPPSGTTVEPPAAPTATAQEDLVGPGGSEPIQRVEPDGPDEPGAPGQPDDPEGPFDGPPSPDAGPDGDVDPGGGGGTPPPPDEPPAAGPAQADAPSTPASPAEPPAPQPTEPEPPAEPPAPEPTEPEVEELAPEPIGAPDDAPPRPEAEPPTDPMPTEEPESAPPDGAVLAWLGHGTETRALPRPAEPSGDDRVLGYLWGTTPSEKHLPDPRWVDDSRGPERPEPSDHLDEPTRTPEPGQPEAATAPSRPDLGPPSEPEQPPAPPTPDPCMSGFDAF